MVRGGGGAHTLHVLARSHMQSVCINNATLLYVSHALCVLILQLARAPASGRRKIYDLAGTDITLATPNETRTLLSIEHDHCKAAPLDAVITRALQ